MGRGAGGGGGGRSPLRGPSGGRGTPKRGGGGHAPRPPRRSPQDARLPLNPHPSPLTPHPSRAHGTRCQGDRPPALEGPPSAGGGRGRPLGLKRWPLLPPRASERDHGSVERMRLTPQGRDLILPHHHQARHWLRQHRCGSKARPPQSVHRRQRRGPGRARFRTATKCPSQPSKNGGRYLLCPPAGIPRRNCFAHFGGGVK